MVDVVEKQLLAEAQQRRANKIKLREGHPHTQAHKDSICGAGNPMYGVHRYDHLNPFYGKRHDAEARRRMRVAACHKVLRRTSNGRLSAIGKGERQYFDQLEKENGWFGNRQHFVSHLGYFVDYYEPYYNIVVEYDEPRHYRHGRLREKDLMRMEQIKEHLGCEFWRYDAYRKQLLKF
jgi:very-short-patch-repair endonuclease